MRFSLLRLSEPTLDKGVMDHPFKEMLKPTLVRPETRYYGLPFAEITPSAAYDGRAPSSHPIFTFTT